MNNAELVTTEESKPLSMIDSINQVLTNPNASVDTIEKMLDMQERIMNRNAEAAFNIALAEMQPKLPAIKPEGKAHNNVRYARFEDIQKAIGPLLAEHGFALSFKTGQIEKGISITAILRHREGHSDETTIVLPSDGSGNKNSVQAVGSSVSYGKRYTATALLNLNVAGEDDDGNLAGIGELVTQSQIEALQTLIEDTETDIEQFCKFQKIDALANMPLSQLGKAIKLLEVKKAKQND